VQIGHGLLEVDAVVQLQQRFEGWVRGLVVKWVVGWDLVFASCAAAAAVVVVVVVVVVE
jgi:hypothetical protein